MDISSATLPAAAMNTASASTLPVPGQQQVLSSNTPAQILLVDAATPAESSGTTEQQTAFNDALLTIINGLLQRQDKDQKMQGVASIPADADRKHDETTDSVTESVAHPQQMLDALLMASQLPVRPVTVNTTPSQSGEAVLMNHRSAGVVAPPATDVLSGGMQPNAQATGDAVPQVASWLTRGLQTVTLQPAAAQPGDTATTLIATVDNPSGAVSSGDKSSAPQPRAPTLKLTGGENRWSAQLQLALGERLQLQVKERIQHATIRLDPPDMGKIDITMQIENGRLQVHINASQGEVYRALQQVSNDLRQSLTEQNVLEVSVQVSSQQGQQQGGREQPFAQAQATVSTVAEPDNAASSGERHDDKSVLLTV